MPKLLIVSGAEAVEALQRLGFLVDRQRGSHVVLKKATAEVSEAASSPCTARLRWVPCGVR